MSSIFPDSIVSDWPQELNPAIVGASIDLSSDGMEFEGELVGTPPLDPSGKALSPTGFFLDTVTLYASYTISTGEKQLNLSATVDVYGSDPSDCAVFRVSINYDSSPSAGSTWMLTAMTQNLNMGHLLHFFPDSDGTTLMNIMDHIELNSLAMDYTYSKGVCSTFDTDAVLTIGPVELDLSFSRTTPTDWVFEAKLTAAPSVNTTFLTILESLVKGNDIIQNIPSFLDIPINSTDKGLKLELIAQGVNVANSNGKTKTQFMSVVLMLTAGDIEISFIQLQEKGSAGSSTSVTKRLLHASMTAIPFPSVPKIPLVGSLTPPFDEIDYDWIHDDSAGTGDKGLTRLEIGAINQIPDFPGLKFQDNVKPANPPGSKGPQDTDILLAAGSHLILANSAQTGSSSGPSVVLDYVFGQPTGQSASPAPSSELIMPSKSTRVAATRAPTSKPGASRESELIMPSNPSRLSTTQPPTKKLGASSESDSSVESGNPTTVAHMGKTFGPLTISNIGLRYENQTITFVFDALVKLGPIEFELIGFGLELAFSGGLSLRTLKSIIPTPVISGLACSFDNPPIEIAGIFLNLSTPAVTKFVGGIVVDIPPYSLLAIGSYSESTFRSIFIFAQLVGPLIEFEVIEVNGISGKLACDHSGYSFTYAVVQEASATTALFACQQCPRFATSLSLATPLARLAAIP